MEIKGWSVYSCSKSIGLNEQYIHTLLSLVDAPKEVKKLVEEEKLPPSIAGEIAYRLKEQPEKMIQVVKKVAKAEKNKLEYSRQLVQEVKLKEKKIEVPKEEFDIIYADPPWEYDFSIDYSRSIPAHYPTLSLGEISSYLRVKKIETAKNAVLFLWVTNPKLEEAFEVIKTWGFEYKTNFVWVKDKIGMGYWNRNQHELLLIATKGNPNPPDPEKRISSVIEAERKEHSEKPEIFYQIIEKMFPHAKRIELFARNKRSGWEAVGLEI